MGKLIFRYGTMNSSKSAQLLIEAYNSKLQGKHVIAFKPAVDTRGAQSYITSRAPLDPLQCYEIEINDNLENIIELYMQDHKLDAVMVDESQFLTPEQVKQLYRLSINHDIFIYAYGLKNSYLPGNLFPGTQALLFYAHNIDEIPTTCHFCNQKATQNLRLVDNNPVYDGELVQIGDVVGEEKYLQVCNYHYKHPKI